MSRTHGRVAWLLGLLLAGALPAQGQQWVGERLCPPELPSDAEFGSAVAVSDEGTIAVGAYRHDRVYLFRRGAAGGCEQFAEIQSPSPNAWFGFALAIHRDQLLVGAPKSGGIGAAYLYRLSTAERLQTVTVPQAQRGDEVGSSVAIYGGTLVLGARGTADRRGQVYFSSGGSFEEVPVSGLAPNAELGQSVALDGTTLVMGAPSPYHGSGPGAAWVFDLASRTLLPPLVPPGGLEPEAAFGFAVAVDGDHILIGAPLANRNGVDSGAVFRFKSDGTEGAALSLPSQPGDQLGVAVALDDDGVAVVGARYVDNKRGEAYLVNVETNGSPQHLEQVVPVVQGVRVPGGAQFGSSVAVRGGIAVVGAFRQTPGGAAYRFDAPPVVELSLDLLRVPAPTESGCPSQLQNGVMPGCPLKYDITIGNSTQVQVSNIRLRVRLDPPTLLTGANLTCTGCTPCSSVEAGTSPCPIESGTLCTRVGTLAGEAKKTVSLIAQVMPTATGTITTHACVKGEGTGTLTDSDRAEVVIEKPRTTLKVEKSVDKEIAGPGEAVRYTITVTNEGPIQASDVKVTDHFPSALDPGSISWSCRAFGGALCGHRGGRGVELSELVVLPVGGTVIYTADARIRQDAVGPEPIENNVSVSSDLCLETPCGEARARTTLRAADLGLRLTSDSTAVPGRSFHSHIEVFNSGPDAVAGAQIVVAIDLPGVTWTCTASKGRCAPIGSGDIHESFDLQPGGKLIFEIIALIAPNRLGTVTTTADVIPLAIDPKPRNNHAESVTVLTPQADLEIVGHQSRPVVHSGFSFDALYTFTVINHGPSAVAGAVLRDQPSEGLGVGSLLCVVATGGSCQCRVAWTSCPAGNAFPIVFLDTISLQPGGTLEYELLAAALSGSSNTVCVTPPAGVEDPIPANNCSQAPGPPSFS